MNILIFIIHYLIFIIRYSGTRTRTRMVSTRTHTRTRMLSTRTRTRMLSTHTRTCTRIPGTRLQHCCLDRRWGKSTEGREKTQVFGNLRIQVVPKYVLFL